MKRLVFALAAALLTSPGFADTIVDPIAAAIADAARPADDAARDAKRHPAELLAFAGALEGDIVVDWIPGGGYFTRLFAPIVGETGRVMALVPSELEGKYDLGKNAVALEEAYPNVRAVIEPMLETACIEGAAVFWTSQNYHDLHTPGFGDVDALAFNRQVFAMLKPGGVYIVVDHAAAPGAGIETADKLHRIDPAIVKQEVEAAGFVFEGESEALRNGADDHTLNVFDEKIRGQTDQFAYKFRKPAS